MEAEAYKHLIRKTIADIRVEVIENGDVPNFKVIMATPRMIFYLKELLEGQEDGKQLIFANKKQKTNEQKTIKHLRLSNFIKFRPTQKMAMDASHSELLMLNKEIESIQNLLKSLSFREKTYSKVVPT